MMSMIFLIAVVALFVALFAVETAADDTQPGFRQTGLFRWIISDNWPAKVGAALLILGVGALLRYALIKVQWPPGVKLGAGMLIAAALAIGSFLLRDLPKRRAIHIALAGAAAGVAYLTAYGAYGFFNYVSSFNALALLALVAIAAGAFAVTANSMSIGILAMLGAFLAPAFAIRGAGVGPVYGYYAAISALSLVMVALRGWRGLIHLSFIFTLAGALFFAWTSKFYLPENYSAMQPLLLLLVAIHIAMPLVERRHLPTRWSSRFDTGYFVLLPAVAAVLTLQIAPDLRSHGALGLAMLGGLWAIAAGALRAMMRDEALRHGLVAALLLMAALLCRMENVPWMLFGLGTSVLLLAVANRLGWSRTMQDLLCGAALLFGTLAAIMSLNDPEPARIFASALFGKRLLVAVLWSIAAYIAHRRDLRLAKLLMAMALVWFLLVVGEELRRLFQGHIRQLVFSIMLLTAAATSVAHRWIRVPKPMAILLVLALVIFGAWATQGGPRAFTILCLLLSPAALLGIAWSRARISLADDGAIHAALVLLPLSMIPWTYEVFAGPGTQEHFAALSVGVLGCAACWWLVPRWQPDNQHVDIVALPIHFWMAAVLLLGMTLLHIERTVPAIVFEVLAMAYLVLFLTRRDLFGRTRSTGYGTVVVSAAALVLQAMLLRLFGPADAKVMSASDLMKMHLPALVSLMWATLGAGLTWWGTHRKSRGVWAAGAALLVLAALKLVFLDFGSLGELGNILAVIAAGLVFLGVAWFAPMPPKQDPPTPAPAPTPPPQTQAQAPRAGNEPPPIPARSAAPVATSASVSASEATPSMPAPATAAPNLNRAVFAVPDDAAPQSAPPTPQSAAAGMTDEARERIRRAAEASAQRRAQAAPPPTTETNAWLVVGVLACFILVAVMLLFRSVDRSPLGDNPDESMPAQIAAAPVPEPEAASVSSEYVAPLVDVVSAEAACSAIEQYLPLQDGERVFDAQGYDGEPLAFGIDQSGESAQRLDLVVNEEEGKVILLLSTTAPTIWNLRWTRNSRIVGVVTRGDHRQVIAGLSHETPVIAMQPSDIDACAPVYQGMDRIGTVDRNADSLVRRIAGSAYRRDGVFIVGAPVYDKNNLISSEEIGVDSYRYRDAPVSESEEIKVALKNGALRRATRFDFQRWHASRGEYGSEQQPSGYVVRAYVVQGAFEYPDGLYGANAATFFIPRGVPKPTGNPGHSNVFDFNR